MPAPGDSAGLLHRLGTAECEAILPRGTHPVQRPQLQQSQEPQVLAQVRETGPGCREPCRPGISNLAQAPASSLPQGTPRREPTATPGERGGCSGSILTPDK